MFRRWTPKPTETHEQRMPTYRFPRTHRILRPRDFEACYRRGLSHGVGPLVVHARPNGLDHPRLGMSVSRRVGKAVMRNRIRRRLRESFRYLQRDVPVGYDVVINVRPHEPLRLAAYQRMLARALRSLHQQWSKRTGEDGTKRGRSGPGRSPGS